MKSGSPNFYYSWREGMIVRNQHRLHITQQPTKKMEATLGLLKEAIVPGYW